MQPVPVSQEEAVGQTRLLPHPLPPKETEPDAGHQVTGREGSLLCTQVQRHPREARTGWAPGGGGDSGHTPACLELWSPKWGSKPGSSSGGGRQGDGAVLTPEAADTNERHRAAGSGRGERGGGAGWEQAGQDPGRQERQRERDGDPAGLREHSALCTRQEPLGWFTAVSGTIQGLRRTVSAETRVGERGAP